MRQRRTKVDSESRQACYHCMTRTVNGERLFGDREKEVLRKMLWQVADFSGVEVLTYALMGNHFHVLVRVPQQGKVSDRELLRRWRVLYPKPTKYEAASFKVMEGTLAANGSTGRTTVSGPCGRSGLRACWWRGGAIRSRPWRLTSI